MSLRGFLVVYAFDLMDFFTLLLMIILWIFLFWSFWKFGDKFYKSLN